jgi:ABC-type proline/glycine betaine transport system ATPase subunit
MSGEIEAYLRDGGALPIPESFFVFQTGTSSALVPPQANDYVCATVETWLREALLKTSTVLEKASTVRLARLEILLDQCDPNASDPDDIQAWQHMGDVGREIIDVPTEKIFGTQPLE